MKPKIISLIIYISLFMTETLSFGDNNTVYTEGPESTPTVVLLTSFETPSRPFWKSKKWEISSDLQQYFLDRFKGSGFRIKMQNSVDALEIQETLTDPHNIAVFIVAHAGAINMPENQHTQPTTIESKIADIDGNDVKSAFHHIHPNMKWLSVIACNAQLIIDEFRREGIFEDNPELTIHSFSEKIEATKGLTQAIDASTEILSQTPIKHHWYGIERPVIVAKKTLFTNDKDPCITKRGYKVNLRRTMDCNLTENNISGVDIEIAGRSLRLLPKPKPCETQETMFFIPEEITQRDPKLMIKIRSRVYLPTAIANELNMGSFTIQGDWDRTPNTGWFPILSSNGQPMGITDHLYQHEGPALTPDLISEFRPFVCAPTSR